MLDSSRILKCFFIAGNALCAGGIFTFPLVSPALASHYKLTQPQLTTIVLAGMMSQYPFAAVAGKVIDQRGPSISSLIGAILFVTGFGAFALEIYNSPLDSVEGSFSSFCRLTVCFLLAGLGTVFSYFSSLFAASRTFPNHLGFASGTTMALFGLSPLFLSLIASTWFTDYASGFLNVSYYMTFLAAITFSFNIFGFFFLGGRSTENEPDMNSPLGAPEAEPNAATSPVANEETRLLSSPTDLITKTTSAMELLCDQNFLLLAIFCVLTLGAAEMVISNMGSIVLSLPSSSPLDHPLPVDIATAYQVRLMSMSNTITRIIIGPLADFLTPAAISKSDLQAPTKKAISRFAFLCGTSALLASTFMWVAFAVRSRETIWALSVGVGVGYSAIFTVLPSIVSSMWGISNLGRNFGILCFAPFIGTPLYSYLYAFISQSHSRGMRICEGHACWLTTFIYCFVTCVLALLVAIFLWRRWKGRV